jgi:hypothetical protein
LGRAVWTLPSHDKATYSPPRAADTVPLKREASCASGGVETAIFDLGESHRGPQRVCETKFVAIGINQVEETLSPFGVAGRGSWLAPCRECTFVKSINIGDVKDHAPPPGPTPLSRLGNEVDIAHPRSKTGE